MYYHNFKRKIKWVAPLIAGYFAVTLLGSLGVQAAPIDRADLLSWNIKSAVQNPSGSITRNFRIKWVNYLAADDTWKAINPTFTAKVGGGFEMLKAPFEVTVPSRSGGIATFHNNNRFDPAGKSKINDVPLDMYITAQGVNDVVGEIRSGDLLLPEGLMKNQNYVIYPNAYPEGDLIYYVYQGKVPYLAKLVKINSAPSKLTYSFKIKTSETVDYETKIGSGKANWDKQPKLRTTKGESINLKRNRHSSRVIGFRPFRVWDSSTPMKAEYIDNELEPTGVQDEALLTKILTSAFFTGVTYPVYTDTINAAFFTESTPSNPVDGSAGRSGQNATWASIHDNADATDSSEIAANTECFSIKASATTDQWAELYRTWTAFDTSSINDAETTIASSTIALAGNTAQHSTAIAVSATVVVGTPALTHTLGTADYDQLGTTASSDTTVTGANWVLGDAYNFFVLNASGRSNISITGTSTFAWRTVSDRDNTPPAWSSGAKGAFGCDYAETAGTASDPQLLVESTEPVAAVPAKANEPTETIMWSFSSRLLNSALAK